MSKVKLSLCGAVLVAMACAVHPAQAVVILGFEINSINPLPLFSHQALDPGDITDDTLTAGSEVDFTVTINGVAVPDAAGFQNAYFSYEASLTSVEQQGNFSILHYDGSFRFDTSAPVDDTTLILAGDFSDMQLIFFSPGGTISFGIGLSVGVTDGSLYTAGPQLTPYLPAGFVLGNTQTANFTVDLLDIDDPSGLIELNDERELTVTDDFTFSSSFSGSSDLVPEPATAVFAIAGLATVFARRRRVA